MNGCLCVAAYIGTERNCLRKAIAANKVLLSAQLNREVDDTLATQDFVDNLIDAFSLQFNRNYCQACPFRGRCGVKLHPSGI